MTLTFIFNKLLEVVKEHVHVFTISHVAAVLCMHKKTKKHVTLTFDL